MARILIAYSSIDGHTREICERLRGVVELQGDEVTVAPLADMHGADLESFDKIVIGASIRYGKHRPAVVDFINRNAQVLNRKPGAFFSVNVVARKPGKNQPHTNPYVRKLLRRIAWHPTRVGVFAGKIDYPRYGTFDRMIIRGIMWLTGGPTDPLAVVDFTDWREVEAFGEIIATM